MATSKTKCCGRKVKVCRCYMQLKLSCQFKTDYNYKMYYASFMIMMKNSYRRYTHNKRKKDSFPGLHPGLVDSEYRSGIAAVRSWTGTSSLSLGQYYLVSAF